MEKLSKEYIKGVLTECFAADKVDKLYSYFLCRDLDGNYIQYNNSILFCDEGVNYRGDFWTIKVGAAKIVFICDKYNEVIKMPLNGYFCDAEDEETEINFLEFIDTSNIRYEDYDIEDYIAEEKFIYDNRSENVQKVLLKNVFEFNFGDVPVYTQRRANMVFIDKYYKCGSAEEAYNSSRSKWKSYVDEYPVSKIDRKFLLDVMDFYEEVGAEIIDSLCNEFDDLHRHNYGYDVNGIPVVFDYGGFYY